MSVKIQNWGRSQSFEAGQVLYPETEQEILTILSNATHNRKNVRTIGSGHSWTSLIVTEDILVSLDRWQGVIQVDPEQKWVEVKSGTKLLKLGNDLWSLGFSMENLGDIDVQSIAGALNTGTHGTGREFGTLATQIHSITIALPTGDLIEISETEQRDLFKAAQVSLGALGIITRYKLKVVKAFTLEYTSKLGKVHDAIDNFDKYNNEYRNYEFYWFPYTKEVQLKLVSETNKPIQDGGFMRSFNDVVIENLGYFLLSEWSRTHKNFYKPFSKFSARGVPKGTWRNHSNKIFATKRWVRFKEMEYNVPKDKFQECMTEIMETIHQRNFRVHMPLEIRYVKADDIMISPATGRDAVYMAVHQYNGMEYEEYFRTIEEIFWKYDGRPHYGKMNTMKKDQFLQTYPQWQKFADIQKECDPRGIMLNTYLKSILH
jgi:FAD-linked oxidoreductase